MINKKNSFLKKILRALIEIGFIIFLFYSNLLMSEFNGTNIKNGKSVTWALQDIFTLTNFSIAVLAGGIGYVVFEFLRKKLQ